MRRRRRKERCHSKYVRTRRQDNSEDVTQTFELSETWVTDSSEDMGNTSIRRVGTVGNAFYAFSKDLVGAFWASIGPAVSTRAVLRPMSQRRQTMRPLVEPRQTDHTKVQDPHAVLDFFESDIFAAQHFREKQRTAPPRHGTDRRYAADFQMAGVLQRWHARGKGATRGGIAARRHGVLQGFVRPLFVVLRTETTKALLLGRAIRGRRSRRFRFQRARELLVRSLLLRVAQGDPLRLNAEANPPDRQVRQPRQTGRSKWPAVVAANPVGQPILGKRAREAVAHRRAVFRRQRVTPQRVATEPVAQGQRIAIDGIAGPELPFEVGRPHVVRACGRQQGRPRRARAIAAAPRADQAPRLQQRAARRSGRPHRLGLLTAEHHQQLARTPRRMPTPRRAQLLHDPRIGPTRAGLRPARSVPQPATPLGLVAADPLVSSLATDAVLVAQLGHREQARRIRFTKFDAQLHSRHSPPRHLVLRRNSGEKCYPCVWTTLLPMSPD